MLEVLLGGLLATVPIAISQAVNVRLARADRDHAIALRAEERNDADQEAKRGRYEDFLAAAYELSSLLQHRHALLVTEVPGLEPVPHELLGRLAEAAGRAVLSAPATLANRIAGLHDRFIEEVTLLVEMGPGSLELDHGELDAIRVAMAADVA